ncbi:cadherin-like domain-containing protein, partial [Candidatus Woesearchaeota archaeon]|nr:cadherin-like domain-containing protein [Candidatus Woesearchaeota archaeon]
ESISPSVFDLADNDADNKLRSTDSIQINLTVNDTNFGSGTVTIGNGTQVSMGLQSSGNDSYQYSLTTNGSALGCTNSDGTCTLRITATDIVNNINNSEIINLTIDDVAPNTTSISINETGTVRNITMLNVTVNVTDTNTITNVSLNGTALENLTGGVWGTVNPTSELCSGIIDSTCTLGVTAYDELGNLNNTQLLTITISSFSPSVSSLPDITISEDGHNATVNLSNYVTDLDTALGDITWTVFGNSSVQLDINQTTKILNVSAAQDFNGSESITFTASDGTNTDTDTLVVTVTPVNDAPTIPSLSSPINNSNISTTYANLTWSASTDVESDNITYHVFFSNTTSLGFNQSTTSTNVVLNNLTKGTTYYWMIIAGDGSLNGSNSSTYQFTAVNNRAPVLNASVPNVTLTEETADTSIDLDNYFSDEDNDALTFSSTTPSNIAVSISSGVVTLTPSSNFAGTNTITFTANDGTDNTTSNEVTLTVANTNDAPTIDSFSPTSDTTIATQLGSQSFSISFSDVDAGDTPTAAWYRNGTSIAPSNSSNVTVTDLSSGVYNITALVTDNASSTARNEWTLTVNGSITSSELTSPVLSLNESERQSVTSVAINQTTSGGIDFGASTLNFSGVSNLEDAINVSNGLISVNTDTYPGLNKSASLVMKNLNYTKAPLIYTASGFESTSSGTLCSSTVCTGVTYDDSTGKLNFDVAHFTTFYTQTNTTNGAPVITTTAPTGAVEDEAFSYNVDATDPDGDTLTYSLTSSPSGMSISSSSGSISYTPSSIGNFSVTLQVSDGSLTDIQSFNVSVGEAPKLRITDLDVRVDNQKDSNLDNNTKISKEAEPGSEIKFEMDIESFFTNEDDIEINNIEVEITIEDIDDGDNLEEEADDFDLDQGDSDDVKIEFEVPYDVEEGTYDVIILVEGEDDNSTMHYIRWELELEVEKENHQVEVLRASTTPDTVQCQRTISVNAEIVNTGSSDEEEVTLEILSSELGINDITQDIELDEGTDDNRYTKLVTATIPEDVAPGTYPIIMNSYYDNKLSGTGTAYLAVQGCERIKTVKKELTADKKVEITFPKTVVDEAPEKEIEISPQGVISQSTLIAILLVIFLGTVIFIGGAAFILLKK